MLNIGKKIFLLVFALFCLFSSSPVLAESSILLAMGGAGSVQNGATVGNSPIGNTAPVVTVPTNSNSSNSQNTSSSILPPPKAGGTYTLLAPIETFFPGGTVDVKGAGLGGYLNGLYKAGIAIATGLALIMIVVGGLEYVSTDSIQGKSNGKERIKNSIIGLLLALTSFIILQQINPNLLKSDLQVESTGSIGKIEKVDVNFTAGVSGAAVGIRQNTPQGDYTYGVMPDSGGLPGGPKGGGTTIGGGVLSSSAIAARIVQSAKNNLNVSTCLIVTENGKKGCGYAFGKIMTEAGITFKNLSASQVLSTTNIYSVLASDSRFTLVSVNNPSTSLPGDIIISPTTGSNVGHVGIIELAQAAKIISNSSGSASIQDYFTGTKWMNYYGGKGLKTYIFRYR